MKRKVFAIAMSVVLIVALVPLFGGAVFADGGGPEIVTTVPEEVGLAVSPSDINFGEVLPGGCSSVLEENRDINLLNTGNCDILITTEITEERVVEGEKLGHGDGSTLVFGPTDYTPIKQGSETVYLGDPPVAQVGGYTVNGPYGDEIHFDPGNAPGGGVLVSIDYEATATFYTGSGNSTGPFGGEPPPDKTYGMTLNDLSRPPEVLACDYSRELVDDQACDPVAQIYVEPDYPVGIESGQIVFWAMYSGVPNEPPTVEFQQPTEAQEFTAGDPVLIQTRNIDDRGVVAEEFSVVRVGVGEVASGALAKVSGSALDGIWEATWDSTGAYATLEGVAYEITVTATDTDDATGDDSVTVTLICSDPYPDVTLITYTGDPDPAVGTVTITATATDEPDVGIGGGLVSGEYRIDGAGDWTAMTPDVGLPANAATFTADWDSTTVDDGDHAINVRVTDSSAQPTTESLAIKVNNLPPVAWTYGVTYNGETAGVGLGMGDGIKTVFSLGAPIDAESETVYVGGVPQVRDTDYTIVNATGTVTFVTPPGGGVAVTMDLSTTDVTTWTLAVETVELVNTPYFDGYCAKINTDYGTPSPVRFRDGALILMYSSSAWVDVATGQTVKAVASIDLYGFIVETTILYEWVLPDQYIQHMSLNPPLAAPTHETHDLMIVGVGPVTVPAGTFVCAERQDWLVYLDDEGAPPPGPVDPPVLMKTEYLDTATPSTGLIKALDYSWDGSSDQVLVSVYDPGA